jgi:hypothetical protein
LIKRLYEQGRNRQDIINFYGLIDWLMTLSKELQSEFDQQVTQYEETMKMPYITSIERSGELKGKQELTIKLFNQRFGVIEQPLIEQIRQLSGEQLEDLTNVLLTLTSSANLERWLQSRLKPVEQE